MVKSIQEIYKEELSALKFLIFKTENITQIFCITFLRWFFQQEHWNYIMANMKYIWYRTFVK